MLELICAACGKRVQGDESLAGQRLQCPVCNEAMTMSGGCDAATAIATPEHAAQARIIQPSASSAGAFSEGLPPLPDTAPPMRESLPSLFMGWLPYVAGVVVVLVGIALLIPAMQKVREAAARTQSINNLKQIGLAFQGFHDANKRLPYNGTAAPYKVDGKSYGGPAVDADYTTGSWAYMILPYIDQLDIEGHQRVTDTDRPMAAYMCPGRGRPSLCTGAGGPGAWTDYFINPFLNDPNGAFDVPDKKLTMIGITDGTSNTILVGHGQIDPRDYSSTDTTAGYTDIIFNGGSRSLCRSNTAVVNGRDSSDPASAAGNWGGPFPQGGLMCMGDGTVRMFPYAISGGTIINGTCETKWFEGTHDFGDGPGHFPDPTVFAIFLTPAGNEALIIPDS
jgi:hypothetical protein